MDDAEARRRFASASVARFATVRPDGVPHLVPVVFQVEGDLVYSLVDPKPKTTAALMRLRNIVSQPRVSLLVDEYDPDWQRLWWVRADGIAEIIKDGPSRDHAIELLRAKYPQYADLDRPFGPAVVVTVLRWASWSFA